MTTISNYTRLLAAGYKFDTLIKSHASPEIQLKDIRTLDRALKILRIDNEFETADIRTWAALCAPLIGREPCIPHERHPIVMAHVPLQQQDTHGDRAILNYSVGTAIRYKGA